MDKPCLICSRPQGNPKQSLNANTADDCAIHRYETADEISLQKLQFEKVISALVCARPGTFGVHSCHNRQAACTCCKCAGEILQINWHSMKCRRRQLESHEMG